MLGLIKKSNRLVLRLGLWELFGVFRQFLGFIPQNKQFWEINFHFTAITANNIHKSVELGKLGLGLAHYGLIEGETW